MLRKVVIGSGLVALIPTVGAATPVKNEPSGPAKPPPMRACDLPIYDAPHAEYAEYVQSEANKNKTSYLRSTLLPPVTAVREQVQSILEHTDSVKHTVTDHYHEYRDRSEWMVKYFREEENKDVRYGAVVMGGVTGFIFGLRGGFIRRVFYSGIGTTIMGFVCFPAETKQIYNNNGAIAKQYINIAYNFLYGVKPGDPQLEIKFPELSIPKDFSELVQLTVSMASSIKQAVMPPPTPAEAEPKPSEKKD